MGVKVSLLCPIISYAPRPFKLLNQLLTSKYVGEKMHLRFEYSSDIEFSFCVNFLNLKMLKKG